MTQAEIPEKSPVVLLEHVVASIHAHMEESGLSSASPDADVKFVARALLRSLLVQAAAVCALCKTPLAEAALANVRTIFEIWTNLRFLLLHGDPTTNARKVLVSSYLEFLDFLEKQGEPIAMRQPILEEVANARREFPEVVHEVEKQRHQKKYHWSGQSRTAVIEQVGAMLPSSELSLRNAYKVLSWDAHGEMSAIRDVRKVLTPRGEELHFAYFLNPDEAARTYAALAFNICGDAWNVFVTTAAL